ncbi:hypothetical protein NE865_15520 [Phthorimaea operculella]|nr:hypothetical protein NE865_15520 [Phthorimaea operculella]
MVMWWCVFLCAVVSAHAKILRKPDLLYLEAYKNADPSPVEALRPPLAAQPRVLAVDLPLQSSVDPLRLRAATDDEVEMFKEIVQPIVMLSEYRRRLGMHAPRDRPRVTSRKSSGVATGKSSADDDQKTVEEIRRVVNKFVALSAGDRDQELMDALAEETNPTLTIYVRGPYGVLIVNTKTEKTRFVLHPPSRLPAWLHDQTHASSAAGPVEEQWLPREVQSELYNRLLRLVKVYMRFDL